MTRVLNRKKTVFRSIAGVLIYCMMLFPAFNTIGLSAMTPVEENAKLSKKEKAKLVEQGVAQYQKGQHEQAKKTLEYAKEVFPANYAVPYYLGLIYLEEGRRTDAIAEWKQYVLMDPKSEDSMKIRKYLTLLIREDAMEYAKQAVSNEASLISGPVPDNTIAVTAFKNLGSENLGPLGKGMAAMLIHDLSQVPDLQVVERIKIVALLEEMKLGTSGLVDQKTAPKVGKLLKSKHVTTGNLTDLEKENLQIVSVVVDSEQMNRINTQEVQGKLKKFYDLEKEIACDIVKDLGRDCSKMPGAFGKIHTKSLTALTSYSVGLDYFDQEKYDEARKEFQKAIDEDPEFDMARKALIYTPLSAMLILTTASMISSLSASGASSATIGSASAGTAVAGGGGGVGVVGTTTAVVVGAAAIGAGVALGNGGGGDEGGTPTPTPTPTVSANLTGIWVGTWTDSSGQNNSGTITLNLNQPQGSTSVGGSATITYYNNASGCTFNGGTLSSGNVSGNNFNANIGPNTANYNATIGSSSMNGTLTINSGSCSINTNPFPISLTGSATINWQHN
jgi:tetratricopeptide (TPR) repeat protein